MKRSHGIVLWLLLLAPAAVAGTLAPTDDGMISRDWYSNPNSYSVDNTSATISVTHVGDMRYWLRGLAIFDISSLAGSDLVPGSATYKLYSFGFTDVSLQWAGALGTPGLSTAYGQIAGTEIAVLPATEGWLSYDVTSLLQASIDQDARYVGLVYNVYRNYGGGSAAAVEDPLGRGSYLQIGGADPIATPEPASLALIGLGLVGLVALGRRRR